MPFPRNRIRPVRPIKWASLAAAAVFALAPAKAQNILPTNGVVASGAASIRQSGANLSVTQTSPRAIVNWGSFSIGRSNGVTFAQPSWFSAILNRVTGSARSTIAGQLQANGQVFLVNPNGIAITPTGAVQVGGGFVASTLGIADSDFNNGHLNFVGNGASAGVANAGSIRAAAGGFVGLLGGTVSNSGIVSVPLGKVAMGSGEQATLNLTGDNFLQVAVPTNTRTADGQALIDSSGKIRAAGGSVQLKAATVAQAIRNAVNVPGELTVASARASGGSIILSGGPGGDVVVSGRLKASGRTMGGAIAISGHNVALRKAKLAARSARGRGGSVTVTGTNAVSLASTSIDASGASGGGAIRIGGDFHGAQDIQSAQTTTIDASSTLNASATASGKGGTVAVWSNGTTSFAGQIMARGGPNGGNGGYVEVSANPATYGVLDFTGSADLTAPKGATGTLLLDPFNITISPPGFVMLPPGGSFSGGNPNTWIPTGTSSIDNATLDGLLAKSNVIIPTGGAGSPGTDAGDITVAAPVAWSAPTTLELSAFHNIVLDDTITATGGGSAVLAATGAFINNVGPGAISTTGGGVWQVYSASPAGDVFGGLNSGNTAVWNTPPLGSVTAPGDRYIFAFQPTITVTASNLIKPFGQDVTALVAADFTISGVQPGVAGAFLGDPASAVFSGTPLVFSAGSPASAPSTAVPYPIIVALGSLVIGDGYGFAANNGLLSVLPLPFDPGFLPGLTQINNPAPSEYDVGGYEQVLPRFTVDCNEPPSLPDPNRYSDPDAALRAISHALENYFKRCQNPTQTTIADALDEYAAKLRILAPRLPPALRSVPTIIAEAARRVRAARTRTEAVAVLRQTVAAVHKAIALVLSEDPETRSRELRDGDVIAGALAATSVVLVNSGGL